MAFKPNLLHGCFCSLCFNSCARQNRKLQRLRILTLLYHTRIIKKFRHLLETQLYEVDSKGIFHWEALDLSRWIPPPLENILNFAPTIYNPLGRSLFGTGEPLRGLKPWPCLKQKYPKIHTLFRKTLSIFFLPCLGSTTLSHFILKYQAYTRKTDLIVLYWWLTLLFLLLRPSSQKVVVYFFLQPQAIVYVWDFWNMTLR